MSQCKHEMAVHGFKIENWHHRWYNARYFSKENPGTSYHSSGIVSDVMADNNVDLSNLENNENDIVQDVGDDDKENTAPNNPRVTYSSMIEKCSNLVRLLDGHGFLERLVALCCLLPLSLSLSVLVWPNCNFT